MRNFESIFAYRHSSVPSRSSRFNMDAICGKKKSSPVIDISWLRTFDSSADLRGSILSVGIPSLDERVSVGRSPNPDPRTHAFL